MKRETLILMALGIVSSVAAWGITSAIDKWMDARRGRYTENMPDDRQYRRNKILAGVGSRGVIA